MEQVSEAGPPKDAAANEDEMRDFKIALVSRPLPFAGDGGE
jgi:hypothetical protein